MTLEERKEYAMSLRKQGYNCAQCIVASFYDITGIDKGLSLKIASGLGTGVASLGEVCGVVTGMTITEGILNSSEPAAKIKVAKTAKGLAGQFVDKNGYLRCKDLKNPLHARPCNDLILDGIEIMHRHLSPDDK